MCCVSVCVWFYLLILDLFFLNSFYYFNDGKEARDYWSSMSPFNPRTVYMYFFFLFFFYIPHTHIQTYKIYPRRRLYSRRRGETVEIKIYRRAITFTPPHWNDMLQAKQHNKQFFFLVNIKIKSIQLKKTETKKQKSRIPSEFLCPNFLNFCFLFF